MNLIKTYWRVLGRHRPVAGAIVLLVGLSAFLEGVFLVLTVSMMEKGIGGTLSTGFVQRLEEVSHLQGKSFLGALIALLLVVGLGSILVRLLVDWQQLKLRLKLEIVFREEMTELLCRLAWPKFLTYQAGALSQAVFSDGPQTAVGVQGAINAVSSALCALVFLGLAAAISLPLTLVALVFLGLVGLVYRAIAASATRKSRELNEFAQKLGALTSYAFGHQQYFRGTGLTRPSLDRLFAAFHQHSQINFGYIFPTALNNLVSGSVGVIFLCGIMLATVVMMDKPMAEVLVFLAMFQRLTPRITGMNDGLYQARVALPWYEDMKRFLDEWEPYLEEHHGQAQPVFERELRLKDLTFSYLGTTRPAIRGINLSLKKGEFLAVVGESGSGKSTLINLFTGLLRPQSGQILLDGAPLDGINLRDWRLKIGLVPQLAPMFYGTIGENIALWEPQVDEARLRQSAEMAQVMKFVRDREEGFDFNIGENGARLSGGQQQRLGLARALYRQPWLLLLDEATSALDPETEYQIQQTLAALKGQVTVLMVTHRLHTARIADRIVLMGDGQVQEEGTWEELTQNPDSQFRRLLALHPPPLLDQIGEPKAAEKGE